MTARRTHQRVIGIIVLLVLLGLVLFLFRGLLLRVVSAVQRPFVSVGTWVTNGALNACDAIAGLPDALALESQRNALAVDTTELHRLQEENAQLRDQLAFIDRRDIRSVPAAITSRASSERAAVFVIDRGARDGVLSGMPVVVDDGILVGKVISTTDTTATVAPTGDPQTATAVTLLNQTRTLGLAEGMAGSLISLRYIPNDEEIEVNNLVVTSGLEEHMLSGLLVGIVNEVRSDPTAPFQEAIVEPLVDLRRYQTVLVLVTVSL